MDLAINAIDGRDPNTKMHCQRRLKVALYWPLAYQLKEFSPLYITNKTERYTYVVLSWVCNTCSEAFKRILVYSAAVIIVA